MIRGSHHASHHYHPALPPPPLLLLPPPLLLLPLPPPLLLPPPPPRSMTRPYCSTWPSTLPLPDHEHVKDPVGPPILRRLYDLLRNRIEMHAPVLVHGGVRMIAHVLDLRKLHTYSTSGTSSWAPVAAVTGTSATVSAP